MRVARRRRHKKPGIAPSALGLLAGFAAVVCTTEPLCGAQSQSSAAGTISVLSFNIRYGTANDGENSWSYRRELVFDVIREAAPDVIGTQEALWFQLDELLAAFPEYSKVGVGRDDGRIAGEFSAILFRPDRFEVTERGTFWFSNQPDVPGSIAFDWGAQLPRVCSWARLQDKQSGRSFYVFNVHLSSQSQEAREQSAVLLVERILARAQNDPIVVTGDFNAGEDNPAMVHLMGQGDATHPLKLHDSYRVLYPDATDVGTFNSFRGTRSGEKIDAVLISAGWEVTSAAILHTSRDGRYPSDHFPVVASLQIADDADGSSPRQ
jgi:endonuclease/exonuclease/phosphatase family metal-dependent hydrolase